jgi:hypothetical protein
MRKIRFVINFNLNLFIHLEVISGSIPQRFSKKYALKYPEFFELAKKFRWEFDPQVISWSFKNEIEKSNAFEKGGIKFGKKIKQIYEKAAKLYKPYWEKEIEGKLIRFKDKLEEKRNQIEAIIEKIENFTGIKFKPMIKIYLVEALSEEYKCGGEILDDGIVIGIIKDWDLAKVVITHELVHLNIRERIIQKIPFAYEKDRDKINEALTDLITSFILEENIIEKETFYLKLFKPFFSNIRKISNFEKFISDIFKQTLHVKGD